MEKKILRMNLLGGMNYYIIEHIQDEEEFERWITYGVPDQATEEDLETIAEDAEVWRGCCMLGGELVQSE